MRRMPPRPVASDRLDRPVRCDRIGIGSLVGLEVPIGLIGLFAGVFVGLGLVYARFRTL